MGTVFTKMGGLCSTPVSPREDEEFDLSSLLEQEPLHDFEVSENEKVRKPVANVVVSACLALNEDGSDRSVAHVLSLPSGVRASVQVNSGSPTTESTADSSSTNASSSSSSILREGTFDVRDIIREMPREDSTSSNGSDDAILHLEMEALSEPNLWDLAVRSELRSGSSGILGVGHCIFEGQCQQRQPHTISRGVSLGSATVSGERKSKTKSEEDSDDKMFAAAGELVLTASEASENNNLLPSDMLALDRRQSSYSVLSTASSDPCLLQSTPHLTPTISRLLAHRVSIPQLNLDMDLGTASQPFTPPMHDWAIAGGSAVTPLSASRCRYQRRGSIGLMRRLCLDKPEEFEELCAKYPFVPAHHFVARIDQAFKKIRDIGVGGSGSVEQVIRLTGDVSVDSMMNAETIPDFSFHLSERQIKELLFRLGRPLDDSTVTLINDKEYHLKLPRMYALKTMSRLDPVNESLWIREVSILQTLNHPNVVRFCGAYVDNDNFYVLEELCTGAELLDRIQEMEVFSERQASKYMREIIEAVHMCHMKGIVHRDLKPDNVLFAHRHGNTPQVIDFGLAMQCEDSQTYYSKPMVAQLRKDDGAAYDSLVKKLSVSEAKFEMLSIVGSPHYVAPEIRRLKFTGSELKKGDMWAVGIIAYILVTGQYPFEFEGKSPIEIIRTIEACPAHVDLEEAVFYQLSPVCRDFLWRLLCKEPSKRMSAKEALQHEWLYISDAGSVTECDKHLGDQILEHLGRIHTANVLRKLVLTDLIERMTTKHKRAVVRLFRQLSGDRSYIEAADIETWLAKNNPTLARCKCQQMAHTIMAGMDPTARHGRIDLDMFLTAHASNIVDIHCGSAFAKAFPKLVIAHTGDISSKHFLSKYGDHTPAKERERLLCAAERKTPTPVYSFVRRDTSDVTPIDLLRDTIEE